MPAGGVTGDTEDTESISIMILLDCVNEIWVGVVAVEHGCHKQHHCDWNFLWVSKEQGHRARAGELNEYVAYTPGIVPQRIGFG